MNNYSDVRNLKIDPIKYLDLKKSEILYILTNEMRYSDEKALLKFDFLKEIITRLKPLRCFILQTYGYLEETIRLLPPKLRIYTLNFLLKAMDHDETYPNAYNCLAQIANRYQHLRIDLKCFDDCELLANVEQEISGSVKTGSTTVIQKKLSLQQIALQYAWEQKLITRQNKDEIAAHYGYKAGNKLYENYCKWSRRANRIADPDGSLKQLENKILLFNSVVQILLDNIKPGALEEIKILQGIVEKTYL